MGTSNFCRAVRRALLTDCGSVMIHPRFSRRLVHSGEPHYRHGDGTSLWGPGLRHLWGGQVQSRMRTTALLVLGHALPAPAAWFGALLPQYDGDLPAYA